MDRSKHPTKSKLITLKYRSKIPARGTTQKHPSTSGAMNQTDANDLAEAIPVPKAAAQPKLKLKFGAVKKENTPSPAPPAPAVPPNPEPPKKLKLKFGGKSRPSAVADTNGVESNPTISIPTQEGSKPKRLKLTAKAAPATKPIVKFKTKGKIPRRELGVGYDSEASDRELDPAIEEQLILRMVPGEDCDYLRKAIEEKRVGIPKSEGGADIRMRALTRDGRRFTVTIRGRMYAASLVDLPCVVEGMKSWDKKGWWKTADICQMLLVLGRVDSEEAAMTAELPKEVDPKTWQYAHGLTPPMRYVRKRRFRHRVSTRTIEAVEDEVERLLEADSRALRTEYHFGDSDRQRMTQTGEEGTPGLNGDGDDYGDEDAEGEIEYDGEYGQDAMETEDNENNLEADLLAAFGAAEEANDPAPGPAAVAAVAAEHGLQVVESPVGVAETPAETPVELPIDTPGKATTADEESSEEGGDEDVMEEDELDQADFEQKQILLKAREDITDLQEAIARKKAQLAVQSNMMLKKKITKEIEALEEDLAGKKRQIGEGDDDDF